MRSVPVGRLLASGWGAAGRPWLRGLPLCSGPSASATAWASGDGGGVLPSRWSGPGPSFSPASASLDHLIPGASSELIRDDQ